MAAAQGARPALEDFPLPTLRPELELLPGSPDATGRRRWLIHDAFSNRFIQIELAAYEVLKCWNGSATINDVIKQIALERGQSIDPQSVARLIDFLYANELTALPRAGAWQSFSQTKAARRHSPIAWLIHNYLFIRIPLVKPQAWLERTLPIVQLLWSRPLRQLISVMGLVGLYLASRQMAHFLATLEGYFSWEGALTGAIALALVKTAHELGHAFASVACGCRVNSMGIAFVVMAPMPYTDVTDAWRLTDRRKRLLIDSAGMITEAAIAAVALFAWAFLPEGPARSAAFVLSAVSVVSSLAINLNPFMRFDGYYLLSELLGVENLQARGFTVGRWRLRELLFATGALPPEDFSPRLTTMLVIYAWAVWIYRFTLFVGIALVVYHYFFKVLGIILFGVEIIYFVARPILGELIVWWKMRKLILGTKRTRVTLAIAALTATAFVVPWSTSIEIPAVLEAAQLQSIHPARNARVLAVHVRPGDAVHAGDPIVTLESVEVERDLVRARISLRLAELQFGRRMADVDDKAGSLVLESSIASLRSKIAGLEKEMTELKIVAPFDGKVVDFNPELQSNRWVSPRDMLVIVAGDDELMANGYVSEADVGRIEPGASARFIPEHASRAPVDLKLLRISTAGVSQIEIAELASTNSGRISVTPDERHHLLPTFAQYQVTLSALEASAGRGVSIRGVAIAKGKPESYLARTWRRALGVLLRESGA